MSDATPERWLPVPGFEVSDLGRIRSFRRGNKPKILRGGRRNGYPTAHFQVDYHQQGFYVHRLVAAAFIGECPEGQEVRHKDGNPANPRLSNLHYGTHAENMQDKLVHGTHHLAKRTHCINGHEFTPENTIIKRGANGTKRRCRICNREANRRAYQKRTYGKVGA